MTRPSKNRPPRSSGAAPAPAGSPHRGQSLRARIAFLLLASGACALVYQVVWLRALRLVFGTTTAAAATTLAIFLGGLGIGALILGRRADRDPDPLRLYARLEAGVAIGAIVSLPLIWLIRLVYVAIGGSTALGAEAGTALRLVLCALVLGAPTFLMGGTLPAAVRALEQADDQGRRTVGLLYGVNTVGAVLGTLWATFVSLEAWGTIVTLLCAAVVNLGVAALAFTMTRGPMGRAERRQEARLHGREPARSSAVEEAPASAPAAPVWLVLAGAGAAGAAFLLMEIVWYRMLAPILGGSTYTIGLILAVALLGIGVGGLVYGAGRRQRRPTMLAFTVSCVLEAVLIAVPFALGDRLALFAMETRLWAGSSFAALVIAWAVVTVIVVLPAAVVSGYQFPLLISLLGAREQGVGREVGLAYATNTAGAIVGSLVGGFALLPLLTAPGLWRGVVYLLVVVAIVSMVEAWRRTRPVRGVAAAAGLTVIAVALTSAVGPTAFWRNGGIGAGRGQTPEPGANGVRELLNRERAGVLWEAEGKESGIAVDRTNAYTLMVDGKSDGNALGDAPTQVMGGLTAALLHPEVKRALVIGLGTGSTAGWLAALPSVERVDVVELEPKVVPVAELCAPVNQDVLKNPKVRLMLGDGREFLLTTTERYDLIFSEPSNPYRAGVATLYTQDFYRAAAARLNPGGILAQWLQGYEIERPSVVTVYATLGTVFPAIETWEVDVRGDLLLTASTTAPTYDAERLRARSLSEPYRDAMARVWGVGGLEGLLSAYVANPGFATEQARSATRINTDDRTVLEFWFAKSVGHRIPFAVVSMRAIAAEKSQDRPRLTGAVDWDRVKELRGVRSLNAGSVPDRWEPANPAMRARVLARYDYGNGKFTEAGRRWQSQGDGAQGPMDLTMLAEIFAMSNDPRAPQAIETLRSLRPTEAEALEARARYAAGDKAAATRHLAAAFTMYRRDPWPHRPVFMRALELAVLLASEDPTRNAELFDALSEPFAVRALDFPRLLTRATIGLGDRTGPRCGIGLAPLEPHVPWYGAFLEGRAACFERINSPLAAKAKSDLESYRAASSGVSQLAR